MKGRVVFPQLHSHPQPSCSVICNHTRTYTHLFILYPSRNLPHTTTTCNLCNFITSNRKRCSFYFTTSTAHTFPTYLHCCYRTRTRTCTPQFRTIAPNHIPTVLRV